MLKEIRIHGRGGQGAVTLAEMIAFAAFCCGRKIQAFPSFGVERRGAPVESFVRISKKPILRRDQIINPDYLIVLDDTLLKEKSLYRGLDKGDLVLINSKKSEDEIKKYFKIYPDIKIKIIDATSLGMEVIGKPIVNTPLLGAFAAATKLFDVKSAEKAILEKFSGDIAKKNIELVQKSYKHIDPKCKYLVASRDQEIVPYRAEKSRVSS